MFCVAGSRFHGLAGNHGALKIVSRGSALVFESTPTQPLQEPEVCLFHGRHAWDKNTILDRIA